MKNDGLEIGLNHVRRAKQGYQALEDRKPIPSMDNSVGLDEETLRRQRGQEVNAYRQLSDIELEQTLQKFEQKISQLENTKYCGTSGLNWSRNAILMVLEERDVR